MKPLFEKIPALPSQSFLCKDVKVAKRPFLRGAWHFHPELEITYTFSSHGKRFVGTSISNYEPGDLVLLGNNTPHCWITHEPIRQRVIQFREDFLHMNYEALPELHSLVQLFEKSKKGIFYNKSVVKKVKPYIIKILQQQGFARLTSLINILQILSDTNDYTYIQESEHQSTNNKYELKRIQVVYDCIFQHYQSSELSIDMIADELNLSKSAFCKFIKKSTKKTFSQLLNEFRLSEACKRLINSNDSIAEIGYAVGFNDLSYFYRRFKNMYNCTPLEYRNLHS